MPLHDMMMLMIDELMTWSAMGGWMAAWSVYADATETSSRLHVSIHLVSEEHMLEEAAVVRWNLHRPREIGL